MSQGHDPIKDAYALLEKSILYFNDDPIGTIAACDQRSAAPNYEEIFVRDFVPSALVFLIDGRFDIVGNFLKTSLRLREQQTVMEGHQRAQGLMPASFKLALNEKSETVLQADFGDRAIGRVAPVDSALWWLILLRAYTIASGDSSLAHSDEAQLGIRQILDLYLKESFETSPAMLVPDASFMIDRRMGVYGHPLEIQALFYGMLNSAEFLLKECEENAEILNIVNKRLQTLRSYVRIYYWLDQERLNEIHRLKTEEFGHEAVNVLNIHPEIIPDWIDGWLHKDSGYLVGNLGAGRMDFRFFAYGNLLSVIFGLATEQEARKLMNLFEDHWDELVGEMPLKIVYPAAEGERWAWVTGRDPKNVPWSYHNGGNWPTLLWAFTASALWGNRRDLAERAYFIAQERLPADSWPEYYDGRRGSLIGRRANFDQVWSAASLIISHRLLEDADSVWRFREFIFQL